MIPRPPVRDPYLVDETVESLPAVDLLRGPKLIVDHGHDGRDVFGVSPSHRIGQAVVGQPTAGDRSYRREHRVASVRPVQVSDQQ